MYPSKDGLVSSNKFIPMFKTNASIPIDTSPTISGHAKCVLATLIYFDVFSYPLTAHEIFERSTLSNIDEVESGLAELLFMDAVFHIRGFYLLHNNASLVDKRLAANTHAKRSLATAKKVTRIIKCFPFVRGVMLSGSISKNYMDKDSDIDYFIVTAPNRLWVCRLFFVLVQKLVFLNRYKYFCYNYMVDEAHVAIADPSLYTAIEASTLLPVYSYATYQHFRNSNLWMQAYYPNYPVAESALLKNRRSILQYLLEPLFSNAFGEWLDTWLMKKIEAKWQRSYAPAMFDGTKNLHLKRHTAKAHTEGHYNRIMDMYNQKKSVYEKRYNASIDTKTHLITPFN